VNLSKYVRKSNDAKQLEKIKEMGDGDTAVVIASAMADVAGKFELGVFKFPSDTFIVHNPSIMTIGFNGYHDLLQWFKRNFAVHSVEIKRGYGEAIIQKMNSLAWELP